MVDMDNDKYPISELLVTESSAGEMELMELQEEPYQKIVWVSGYNFQK